MRVCACVHVCMHVCAYVRALARVLVCVPRHGLIRAHEMPRLTRTRARARVRSHPLPRAPTDAPRPPSHLKILVKGQKTKGWRFGAQLGVAAGAGAATTALGYLFTRFYVRRRVAEVTIPGSLQLCSSRSDHAACTTGSKRASLDSEAANGDDEKSDDLVRLTTARPDSHVAGAEDAADVEGARSAGEVWCASDNAEGDGALVLEAADGASSAATRAVRLARARRVFAFALVFVATLESFAHGANDTANATAPLSAVWGIYHGGRGTCGNAAVPLWILAAAGFFVFLGVVTFGRRVIDTVGRGMTRVDTAMGFRYGLSPFT